MMGKKMPVHTKNLQRKFVYKEDRKNKNLHTLYYYLLTVKAPFTWKEDDPSARIILEGFVWFTCKTWKEDDPSAYTDYAGLTL